MPRPTLDQVLLCPNLPSLPAAALSIIELIQDRDATLDRIARTIQTDPALATRVLRTVNSSFYSLREPCSSIGRALGLLGLKTVRSIVLGFTLVDGAERVGDGGFDLATFWRRGVFAAAASKLVAEATRTCDRDEAFLAALIQDIGMLATYAALRGGYARVVEQGGPEHARLCMEETKVLGFAHTEVGERLALKWRLPRDIAACIRSHHGGQRELASCSHLARAVALGTLISATLTEGDVGENVEAMRSCARDWFSLDENASRGLQDQARVQGRELARSLEVHLGDPVDVPVILATAQERLLETQIETSKELDDLRRATSELSRQADIDTLTGAHTRKHFDTRLGALFADSIATGAPLGLLFIDADRFKSINDTHGHKVGDTVLVGLVDRIRGAVGIRGEVCRVGGEEFTVLLPGASLEVATGVGREVQTAVAASPLKVRGESVIRALRATVSVGVASLDRSLRLGFSGPAALLEAADRAVYRAKAAGGNGVCAAGPQPAASKKRAA